MAKFEDDFEGANLKKERKEESLQLLLEGYSPTEVSKMVGVSKTTLWRWRSSDEEFKAKYEMGRAHRMAEMRRRADCAAERMLDVLMRIAEHADNEDVRRKAAKDVLELTGVYAEHKAQAQDVQLSIGALPIQGETPKSYMERLTEMAREPKEVH